MSPHRRLFDLGALPYDLLTGQELWAEQSRRLLEALPVDREASRALDLGCGPGVSAAVLAAGLPRARVVGLDLSPAMLTRARRHLAGHPQISLCAADAGHLPLVEDSFDVITGHSFLYLVPDPAQVLREVVRVLRPGGWVGFLEPAAGGSLRRAARVAASSGVPGRPLAALRFAASMIAWRFYSDSVGRLEPASVERLLREAGLDQVVVRHTLGGLGLHCLGRYTGGV